MTTLAPPAVIGHDRATESVDPDATLGDTLSRLRLAGAVFLRAEYRESWAYESMAGPATAAFLRPGTDRVILFHVVASGTCWVEVDGERHWAGRGDVIVLPYGDQHRMGGLHEAAAVPIQSIMPAPPWTRMPVIRHGADGPQTDVICGYLHSEDALFDPKLRAFAPVFVVRPSQGAAAEWVRANVAYALEQTSPSTPGLGTMTRLPEMLLIEVLRLHLMSAPAAKNGWIAALRDAVLAPALAAIHGFPQHKWTVAELAKECAVSRSLLDERFRQIIGYSPIRYLTEWRMHLAADLLMTTELSVFSIARRVGYDAEEAFSRAFKRARGAPPSVWRCTHACA
jgi:AraC-like DNA-binding protein